MLGKIQKIIPEIKKNESDETTEIEAIKQLIKGKKDMIEDLEENVLIVEEANTTIKEKLAEFYSKFDSNCVGAIKHFILFHLFIDNRSLFKITISIIFRAMKNKSEKHEKQIVAYKDIYINLNYALYLISFLAHSDMFLGNFIHASLMYNQGIRNEEYQKVIGEQAHRIYSEISNKNIGPIDLEGFLELVYDMCNIFKNDDQYKDTKEFLLLFPKVLTKDSDGHTIFTFEDESMRNFVNSCNFISETESVDSYKLFFQDQRYFN